MKKFISLLITACFILNSFAQYNLGFEEMIADSGKLVTWNIKSGPTYSGPVLNIDKEIKHGGNQSLSIERKKTDTATQFTPVSIFIPAQFNGYKISISGWLKTENVSGYAELWFRTDNEDKKLLSLINYPHGRLKGTTDWTKYDTTINLPEDAHIMYFGFLIVGTGKVWGDDLSLKVDGTPIEKIVQGNKIIFPALKDNKEFAKGSGISIQQVTSEQTENIALLAKAWGFLKYYHPYIAKGNLNWDYELFRFLPSYLTVANKKERNDLLLQLINKLEKPAACRKCSDKELKDAIYKPDLDWISNSKELGDSLSAALNYIKENRHLGKNYYMDLVPGVSNPLVTHENSYFEMTSPDAGYRLLCLFRYWNLIQYWFPYKHLIGEDWNNVLSEFIPKMIKAADATQYAVTTRQLIARIHDTHANTWGANKVLDSLKGKFYPPVKIKFLGEQPVISQVIFKEQALASNLEVGDIILTVGNKKISAIITETLPDLPASNKPTQLRDLAGLLLRSNDSISAITLLRNGKEIATTVLLVNSSRQKVLRYAYDFPYMKDSSFFFIKPGIGYINLGTIKRTQVDSIFKALEKSAGLIIDNRQYPGDFPIYDIAGKLLPEKQDFTKIPAGSLEYPGAFFVNPSLTAGKKNKDYYKGKLVILVNENTQSSAEFHTMAFRIAPSATVIGSTTAGADGNVSGFYLPGGIYTMFSGISILYPDGRETQRIGIVPDIEVKPTVAGIKQGRDELIEKAIEIINGKTVPEKKKGFLP
jgi:C-terminal processing protease CtpA/Prc